MNTFFSGMYLIWNFLKNTMTEIFNLYMSMPVFMAVFAIWLVRRLSHIFKIF